jgi:hypothetical protein
MKQINLRVEDDIKAAYLRFCNRQGIGPNEALSAIVRAWAQAEILREQVAENKLDRAIAVVQLGRLVKDLQKVVKLNGEFRQAVAAAASEYKLDIKELGL